MAKICVEIGFAETVEVPPDSGIWEERITVRKYYGDLNRNSRRLQSGSDKLNDDVNISNEVSIISDPFAYDNFCNMRYIKMMGCKWKITDVEVNFPRLRLSIGGIYNG